ncbi:hypothetical protein PAXRUDRAFT_171134, partial [Paxillus rubicundulus Ve08.2h10]
WSSASLQAVHAQQSTAYHAKNLQKWSKVFINDRKALPLSGNGKSLKSRIDDDDVATDIALHLQGLGKYVRSQDIIDYIQQPGIQKCLQIKKLPHLATAKRWMKKMGYRWTKKPSGQYVDGHERDDVVYYYQMTFLPAWQALEHRTRKWLADNSELLEPRSLTKHHIVVWFHDELMFYVNDRRVVRWVFKGETIVPRTKGEVASLMVADFVSADYSWLRSPDGKKEARVLFRCGKGCDGYFTNDDICNHASSAMDILDEYYSNEDHILIFNNATTHLKRADTALLACKTPKNTPKEGRNWGVEVNQTGTDRKPVYAANGKINKIKVPMEDGAFDGKAQPLYFPPNHKRAGTFKGMAVILEECSFGDVANLKAQWEDFKCPKDATDCCCCRILYTEPDFMAVESLLETHCKAWGYQILFLPKFHCELNFIKQCWGYAKCLYHQFPASSKEADLGTNVLAALDSVPLITMCRFATRSHQFIDVYLKGLTGKQAAWASKKYQGHRVLPDSLMEDLDDANLL